MADHSSLFEDVRADVNKQATALFSKQVKKASLENIRGIYSAVGRENFRKMVDLMTAIGPLLKRLDKYNPELKTMAANQQREALNDLASSKAQPTSQPVKVTKAKKATKRDLEKKREKGIMDYESMKVRDREKE
jgi:hypothetical protein